MGKYKEILRSIYTDANYLLDATYDENRLLDESLRSISKSVLDRIIKLSNEAKVILEYR